MVNPPADRFPGDADVWADEEDPGAAPAGSTTHNLLVGPEAASSRLDRFLADALPHLSRARIQALMEQGHVRLDGGPCRPAQRVREAQRVSVCEPPPVEVALLPQDLPLSILFEDAHVLVLNKASGMVVHPAAGNPDGTLVNALLHHIKDLPPVGGEVRPGIVHRLDKDTSGVMVVAKGDAALRALQDAFKARTTVKRYLALVRGQVKQDQHRLETPYGRHATQRMKYTGRAGPRTAVTQWTVLGRAGAATAVLLALHTGRTHQIRVHMSEAGHPLLGDALYGGTRAGQSPGMNVDVPRHMLHAASLAFPHPVTGAMLSFVAPLPDDMRQVAASLGLEGALMDGWTRLGQ